jgi:hypothetical protein
MKKSRKGIGRRVGKSLLLAAPYGRGGLSGKTKPHNLSHNQHKQWLKEMHAQDLDYIYDLANKSARGRGRARGQCECSQCGWHGAKNDLRYAMGDTPSNHDRRPDGRCPKCNTRAFWAKLTEGQALLLAP